jgi:hypothetical protein
MSENQSLPRKLPSLLDCFNHICARPAGNVFLLPFFLIVLFSSFESVPQWAWFNWNVDFTFWLLLAGISGAVAGGFSAERRLTGAIALGLCGVGAVATLNTVLSVLPMMHLIICVIIEAIGFLPGLAVYWVVECVLGRPADAIELERIAAAERVPTSATEPTDRRTEY